MAGSSASERAVGFRFRRLDKPEEFRQVEEVQRAVWGDQSAERIAPSLQRAVQDNGGLVLGAFADIHLAGFTVAFLGWDGTSLYLYAHLLAVRPEYQNHHVGLDLAKALRVEVLQLGLGEIRLAFDPLQSRNAWLFVRRLGGLPDRYLHHYFGQMPDAINLGMESDRVRLVWSLASPRVESRLGGTYPSRDDDRARWHSATAIVSTEPGESGLRLPTEVAEPAGPTAHLEIPFDLDLVRQHEPDALRRWRHATRDAFRAAADLGYRVDDFAVVTEEHERRSFYYLSKSDAAAGEPEPTPTPKS
ncbi:MAG: GNAT family N-acetyltransferase [Thermoplasmata archaeon]